MHSDNIKEEINKMMNQLDDIENEGTMSPEVVQKLEIIRTRAILLSVITMNELNWSFFYTKEELKNINRSLSLSR